MSRRSKWQDDPNEKKTQVASGKKPNDKKTQVEKKTETTGRHEWQKDMWQEESVAERLTDGMLSDGRPAVCWMSILKKLKLCLSNREDNNTSTASWSIPQ